MEKKNLIRTGDGKIRDEYSFTNTADSILGRSQYGCILRAKTIQGKIDRAVKVVDKAKVRNPERFVSEVEIMKTIVKILFNSLQLRAI